MPLFDLTGSALEFTIESIPKLLKKRIDDSKQRELSYAQKLEEATTDVDVFKYLLLIDNEALEGYILLTKSQAEQSFRLSKWVAGAGFVIIAIGVSLGIAANLQGANLDAAYLASVAGVLTEFIGGVFFYLYNKTLQQMNLFHDKLTASKQATLEYLAKSLESQKSTIKTLIPTNTNPSKETIKESDKSYAE